jgi:hypothetical protein
VEPTLRLWKHSVPPPRIKKQIPECIEKRLGPTSLVNQALPLCSLDLSLCRTLVTITEERSEIRPQIDLMKAVALRGAIKAGSACKGLRRTNFDVPELFLFECLL